jgi:hypothetical protein
MIRFIEVLTDNSISRYSEEAKKRCHSLREIFVNPGNIVYFVEDTSMKHRLENDLLHLDIDKRQSFTRLFLKSGNVLSSMTVVGEPKTISEKLNTPDIKKHLLQG